MMRGLGKIIADLAAAVALGVDCLVDIAILREQPELAGRSRQTRIVTRLVSVLAADAAGAGGDPHRAGRARERRGRWSRSGPLAAGLVHEACRVIQLFSNPLLTCNHHRT